MIYVFLADGFEEMEAISPVDVLRRAGCAVQMVGISGKQVTGAHGISVSCDILPAEIKLAEMEMMVLPGGMPGADNLNASPDVQNALAFAAQNDRWIAAICAAPLIPGEKGLLAGREATCYPGFEDRLKDARLSNSPVCVDGRFITADGPGAALAFSLRLAALLKSEETANEIGAAMQCRG